MQLQIVLVIVTSAVQATVQQLLLRVLVIVTSVQVLVQNITVRQAMLFAQILLAHAPAQVVA